MTKRGKYTTDIIALNAEGWTGKRIAEHLGCSGPLVSKVLCRHRTEVRKPHRVTETWQRGKPIPNTCQEWVFTPEGLQPCGAPKHQIDDETKGQCTAHYEAQRPLPGRIPA